MNRKALLIGNSNGLQGVKKDISKWKLFLTSDFGGRWFPGEIEVMMNPRKTELLSKVNSIKGLYDFVIVVFSGHGAYSRSNNTILEINGEEETICENDLKYLACRQISVFDCCRGIISIQDINESIKAFNMKNQRSTCIREDYEKRIMQSIPQQISLYACSIGESAYDSNDGGYYTKNLLSSTNLFVDNQHFLTVGIVHQAGAQRTTNEVFEKEQAVQRPDAFLPKCLSSQQLIISINPRNYEQKSSYHFLY